MLSFSHVCDYIGGKAGGKPQIFLPHIAFYQCMPEWFITYIHPCSCPFFTDGSKSGILPAHPYLSGYRVICPCRSCRSGKSIFYFRYGSYFSMTESETPFLYSFLMSLTAPGAAIFISLSNSWRLSARALLRPPVYSIRYLMGASYIKF